MGVPLSLVIEYLKTSNNEIPVAFVVEGNLDNPKFSLQEEFVAAMTIALAGKLGFSIEGVAQSLLGGSVKGAGDVGSSVKGYRRGSQEALWKIIPEWIFLLVPIYRFTRSAMLYALCASKIV